jgi:hypothetical protein
MGDKSRRNLASENSGNMLGKPLIKAILQKLVTNL